MSAEDKQIESAPVSLSISKPKINRVNVAQAFKDRMRGLTYDEIAIKQGVSRPAITKALDKFKALLDNPEQVQTYQANQAQVLDAVQMRLVTSMVAKSDDEKASVNNLAYAARQVFDMSRLLRDQSTQNVSQLTQIIESAHAKKEKGKPQDVVVEPVHNEPDNVSD